MGIVVHSGVQPHGSESNWMTIMRQMQFRACLVATMLGLLGLAATAAPPGFPLPFFNSPTSTTKWHTNLQSAHKQAVAENKPILIVFGAEWCGFCTKLEKQTLSSKGVSQYINDSYVAVHLDLDKEKRIGEILEVESLPCSIMLSPKADLLGRINGFEGPASYQQKLMDSHLLYQRLVAQNNNSDAVLR